MHFVSSRSSSRLILQAPHMHGFGALVANCCALHDVAAWSKKFVSSITLTRILGRSFVGYSRKSAQRWFSIAIAIRGAPCTCGQTFTVIFLSPSLCKFSISSALSQGNPLGTTSSPTPSKYSQQLPFFPDRAYLHNAPSWKPFDSFTLELTQSWSLEPIRQTFGL